MVKDLENLTVEEKIILIQIFTSLDPVFAEPLSVSGILLYRNKQYLDSLRLLQKSIIIDIGLHESRYLIRKITEEHGYFSTEEQKISRDVRINPNKIYSWMVSPDLRETLTKGGFLSGQIEKFYKWIALHIDDHGVFHEIVEFFTDELDRAENRYELSHLYSMRGHFLLAEAYLELNDDELLNRAYKDYKKAVELDDNGCRASALRALSEINFLMGMSDEALRYSDLAIECDKNYQYAYITKGIIEWKRGNYDEAIHLFSTAIEKYLLLLRTKSPSEDVRKWIVWKVNALLKGASNKIDTRKDFQVWVLSSYFYGYCPFHPDKIPYFDIKKKKNKGQRYLRISHSIISEESVRKYSMNHSIISKT